MDKEDEADKCLGKYLKDGNCQEVGKTSCKQEQYCLWNKPEGGGLSKRIRSIGKRTENMIGFKTKIVEGLGPS